MLSNDQSPTVDTKKLKVLFVYPGPRWDLQMGLEDRLTGYSTGMRGTVLTSSGTDRRARFGNFDVIALNYFYKIQMYFNVRLLLTAIKLAWRARHEKYDLVVASDPLKAGFIAWLASRVMGAACLVEVNGDFTNWANYSDIKNPLMRKFKRSLYLRIIGFVLKRVDGIRQLYPGQLNYFKHVTQNKFVGTLFDLTNLDGFKKIDDQKVILIIGYPLYVKGIDIAIQAFKKIQHLFPDWKLKILGWYMPERDTQFFEWIKDNPQIFHHEPVLHKEMPRHIGSCGLYLLASRTEGIPRILIEAMYSEKACIAANVGGVATMFKDGESGILFQAEDVDGLAAQLARVIGDESLRAQLGENASKHAREAFSKQTYFSKTIDLYREMLNQHR